MLLEEAEETLGVVWCEDLTAVYLRRLLSWEEAYEVEDEFALGMKDDSEVSVLTLAYFLGEFDVELWGFLLFFHCFVSVIVLIEDGLRASPPGEG